MRRSRSRLARLAWLPVAVSCAGCVAPAERAPSAAAALEPQFTLTADQTHNRFSRAIPPVLRVPSGAVVEAFTEEASDGQLTPASTAKDVLAIKPDPIHPLTGPVYVEGAEPGDVLAVKIHVVEVGSWGWACIWPGFGFLADEFKEPALHTFQLGPEVKEVTFGGRFRVPIRPFAGVMGVAPDTDERLSTIPPRANGGNMDDPTLVAGTTVYFPVFVKGALFSIGDAHAAQGMGEVCGTGIEAPMRIVYQVSVKKGTRRLEEPEYETADVYATTGFATTIDGAAKKATRHMIDYLVAEHGMTRNDAYVLCSLAADLKIAETVDVPHMFVTMHMPKRVLGL
jgi:acetamidase/formamidase